MNERQDHAEGWELGAEGHGEETPKIFALFGHFGCDQVVNLSWAVADAKALQFVQAKAREGSTYRIEAPARTQLL